MSLSSPLALYPLAILLGILSVPAVTAQSQSTAVADTEQQDVISYPAEFFSRFQPNSALDMLEQLPGFRMSFGGELRGYGSSPGNVMIDGRRPSSKRVTVPSILDRIPASQVERIDHIRGQVRDIEMLGQPEVANVIMKTDTPAAVRWALSSYHNTDVAPMPWFSNISLSDRWAGIDYNAGLDVFRSMFSERNDERIVDGDDRLVETRDEDGYDLELEANFDLTASKWVGETLWTWNSQIGIQDGSEDFTSRRDPLTPGDESTTEITDGVSSEFQFELGLTAERSLSDDLSGTLLLFFSRENEKAETSQFSLDDAGDQTRELFEDSHQIEKEAIVRTDFEWSAFADHTIRLNMEGTYNLVDNTEDQTEDTGAGPMVISVPGANTVLTEYRGDFLLKDTWSLGKFEFDYGLGAEVSRLKQTGDVDVERDLKYLKPHAELTYTPGETRKLRWRLAREVAQLVFNDFISVSLLTDDDVALGNPNLKPETTWKSEFGIEQRFGPETVLKLTLFHHWIDDVQDLIPVGLDDEAPGNIGTGRRWGVELEGTISLVGLGLTGARLDINSRWQDSSVTDPVTGEKRVLTSTILADDNWSRSIFDNDNEYVVVIDYRQDFEATRIAWGWEATFEADLPVFKVNELDTRDKGPALDLFVETTRWFGIKIRAELNNALDRTKARERAIYTGQRGLSPILRRQLQDRTDGREFGISLSGSF